MSSLPSPFLRALEGLSEGSGRTIVVAGPPLSGKSALLGEFRNAVLERGGRIAQLKGSYRLRSVPFGALDGLHGGGAAPEDGGAGAEPGNPEADLGEFTGGPVVAVPYLSDDLPRSRRPRGGRGRSSLLVASSRPRASNEGDPVAYWRQLVEQFRGPEPATPFVILIEDATLFDSDSREFVVALTRRARLRPLVIALSLDTSNPGYLPWEEGFVGRGDVDWISIPEPLPDPREAHRLKAIYDDQPSASQRIAGYVALLGGSVGEVVLSRVTRLNFPQLAEAILPAAGAGLLKVVDGKVTIPHQPWISLLADQIPDPQCKEMHFEIANALAALSPEPNLQRRIEVAHHYLAWMHGPMALRWLLDAAELSLEVQSFDRAVELLGEALSCTGAAPSNERLSTEADLRLLRSRALFYAGRPSEAEAELRDGLSAAFQAQVPPDLIAEWIEPLFLAIRAVGPRPSLVAVLSELAERAHDDRTLEVEVLLDALLAELNQERRELERARMESHRAALIARRLPEGHMQGMALVAVSLSRIEGTAPEQEQAARFLRAARVFLGKARRWELDYVAEDLSARLHELRGEGTLARQLRERSVTSVERQKLLPIELSHRLGLVEALLDEGATKGVPELLARARTLAEMMHLVPPSPLLARLWLAEGRIASRDETPELARDWWLAVADARGPSALPRPQAEALVRLALLDYARGVPESAAEFEAALRDPATQAALPAGWKAFLPDLARIAPGSEFGAIRLPPRLTLDPRPEAEGRERRRR